MNTSRLSLSDIENTLYHLNYRWNLQALALWKGDRIPFKAYVLAIMKVPASEKVVELQCEAIHSKRVRLY
jgi:hypothetical protein